MTSPAPRPDEASLQAWIDDRLDAARAQRVDAWLADHETDRQHAMHCRAQNRALDAMLQDSLNDPVPEHLRQAALGLPRSGSPASAPTAGRQGGPMRWNWRLAAAVLLSVAAGFTVGWASRDRLPDPVAGPIETSPTALSLTQAATVAFAAYAPEVRHPVEVGASEQAHLVAWLSKRLGTSLRVPDLSASGYTLIGGRLLPDATGAVAAQFMFECSKGTRLTLFVRRDTQGNDTAFRFARDHGVSTFYWLDRGFGYALSADQPKDFMYALARQVYSQLNPDR